MLKTLAVQSQSEICLTTDCRSEIINLKNTSFQNTIQERFDLASVTRVSLNLGFE
jgi:hypothetical protein